MSAHVICVTSGGGLPIFSRRKGNVEAVITLVLLILVPKLNIPVLVAVLNSWIPKRNTHVWKAL